MTAWTDFLAAHPDLRRSEPLVVAHRGYSGVAPENTIPAFDAAWTLGCDFVELDLTLSVDGVPVVIHDDTLERTTDGTGLVERTTAADLFAADAASWLWPGARAGTPEGPGRIGVPSFAAVLHSMRRGGKLFLEFKDWWPANKVEEVAEMIRDAGVMDQVVVQSFNVDTLANLHRVMPDTPRCLLRYLPRDSDLKIIERYDVIACNPSVRGYHARKGTAQRILAAGVGMFIWTANRPGDWAALLAGGVSGIITDHPGRLQGYLAASSQRLVGSTTL